MVSGLRLIEARNCSGAAQDLSIGVQTRLINGLITGISWSFQLSFTFSRPVVVAENRHVSYMSAVLSVAFEDEFC